jgi:HPt (histidine-containing phosphotransfer) domain-containing protein
MSKIEDKTAALLAGLWVKVRPLVEERFATLDAAAAGVSAGGSLSEDSRKEAQSAAHKLAGSLGMYGFDEGTRVARQLEVLLESCSPESARFKALMAELHAAVFPSQ